MSGPLNRTIMWVTFRQLFTRQRFITAVVVSLIPFIIAFSQKAFHGGEYNMQMGRFLIEMYKEFVIGTLLPLVAVVFGSSAFGTEMTEGTIVYTLVKPEPRWRVVLSKFVVAVLATVLVMVPAVVLPWTLVDKAEFPLSVPTVILGGATIGALLYSALFIALSIMSKRALVMGLVYIIVIEFTLSRQAAGVKSFSVRELVLSATSKIGEGNRWFGPADVTLETFYTMGTICLVGSLLYSWRKFARYEMAEKL
jgi:ABC-2 type transport system permease protein